MGLTHERKGLEDDLRRAARGLGPPNDPYIASVESISEHLAGLAKEKIPDAWLDDSVEMVRIAVVEYDQDGLAGRSFHLCASGSVGRERYSAVLAGTCDVTTAQVQPETIRVWPEPASNDPDEPLLVAPVRDDARFLKKWALFVVGGLVLMSIAGALAARLAALDLFDRPRTDVPEMLALAVTVGWVGSCLAALRSFIERSGEGVEYDCHENGDREARVVGRAQWPQRPKGKQRFNSNVARGLLLRPLLGALAAPIIYFALFVTSSTVQVEAPRSTPDSNVGYVLIGVAGLGGLFAKTMLDNLNKSTRNLFKPH